MLTPVAALDRLGRLKWGNWSEGRYTQLNSYRRVLHPVFKISARLGVTQFPTIVIKMVSKCSWDNFSLIPATSVRSPLICSTPSTGAGRLPRLNNTTSCPVPPAVESGKHQWSVCHYQNSHNFPIPYSVSLIQWILLRLAGCLLCLELINNSIRLY